jgi:hypothetical protein
MNMVNFASAEIEVMIHATEDSKRVLSAIKNIFPIEAEEFAADNIKGHFGNEIIRLKANLNSKRATDIAYKIISMMSKEDRILMHDNFDLYTDEKNTIYVRISKQKIFERKIALEQSDSLKIKLKTVRRFQGGSELENYRQMLMKGYSK